MPKLGRSGLAILLMCTSAISGCAFLFPPHRKIAHSWFDVQRNYAKAFSRQMTHSENKSKIIAINGATYAIGTPISRQSDRPLTASCDVPVSNKTVEITKLPPMPASSIQNVVALRAGVPPEVAAAINKLNSVNGSSDDVKKLQLSYTHLTEHLASFEALKAAISNYDCAKALSGQRVTMIRGYLDGYETAATLSYRASSGKVRHLRAGAFRVSYTNSESFRLSDERDMPRFYVVTDVLLPNKRVICNACYLLQSRSVPSLDVTFLTPTAKSLSAIESALAGR